MILEVPIMRLLQQSIKTTETPSINPSTAIGDTSKISELIASQNSTIETTTSKTNSQNKDDLIPIHINGTGVSGIAATFIFFISVFIGIYIMMAIFVNTKTIDEPLKMGRIEH